MSKITRKNGTAYLLLLPSLAIILLLYAYPILLTIIQSFHKVNLLNAEMNSIGLENYVTVFKDPGFWTTLKITFKYTTVTVFFKIGFGFALAFLLYQGLYLKKVFRFLILIPWAIPQVAVSTLWIWILDGNYGYLNYYLQKFGLIKDNIAFLSNPDSAFFAAAAVDTWLGISLISMMFLTGLEAIPRELYEACAMDGASKFRQFTTITLPGIKKVFLTTFILVAIWTFNSFNVIYVLTQGGPMRATETLVIRIYQEAFSRFDLGLSATLTVVAVVILMICTFIYMKRTNYEEL